MLEGPRGLTILPGSDDRLIWVPARRTLKHALFTVPEQLRGAKRTSALELKVKAWSHFQNTDFSVVWSNNFASVFAWDREALTERIKEHGFDPADCEILPEAFLRSPAQNEVRIVGSNDGVEAQVCTNGLLKSSRWWPSRPNAHEWALFVRTSGVEITFTIPKLVEPDWLETPWSGSKTNQYLLAQALRHEPLLAASIAILIAPCIYLGAEYLTYSLKSWDVKQEIEAIEEESREIRYDRMRALSALETAEDLVSLRKHPHQIEIMSRAHNLLTGYGAILTTWDYDKGVLEFGLESGREIDSRVFISSFENDALFSSVSASTRSESLIMRMNVAEESMESIR